tara:strand:+ start:2160 stop:2399 length:240 start_codon:yes stop_codon:yes gene_type:complete
MPENNCVVATYKQFIEFRTPHDLTKVHKWVIKYRTLYVWLKEEHTQPLEYSQRLECASDWKWPDETEVVNEEDIGFDAE